jgi:DNA-binding transcriptional ArsR family regulator
VDTEVAVAESDLRMLQKLRPETRTARMSPDEYLATTAEAMVGYWREVLAPLWDRIDGIVTADIAHHRAALAAQGLGAALPGLHEELSFAGETVRVAMHTDAVVQASGRGVWFVPSVFRWPWISVDIREREPVVSYAARGAGRVWEDEQQSDLGLVELLGRSRAEILRRLDVPRSTTGLARDLELSPSTVSWHLSVMSTSGLLGSRREGRRVLYSRTLVGDLLARGGSALEQIG